MSFRLLLLLAALPVCALAQLQLYVVQAGVEQRIGSVYDAGTAAAGDVLDTRMRVRNLGNVAVNIQTLSIGGVGFSLQGRPSLPFVLAPGLNLDFTVRFAPTNFGSFSANLTVNSINVIVRGTGLAAPVLSVELNGVRVALSSGETVDFGVVDPGGSAARRVILENTSPAAQTVNSVQVSGPGFRGPVGVVFPLRLNPGSMAIFEVLAEPATGGIFQGTLAVDGRTFRLTAAARQPQLPTPVITVEPQNLLSAQQGRVSIRFESPAAASASGVLRMEFRPLTPGTNSDEAIQFIRSSSLALDFTVAAGGTQVSFAGAEPQAVFQTGTTAGTLVFIVESGSVRTEASVTIAATVVGFDQAAASRNANGVEVQITGFDNTRSISEAAFTFFDQAGQPIGPQAIRSDVRTPFQSYFGSSSLGGVFSLRATFPVTGDATAIGAVEAELVNSAGAARTQRIRF